MKYTKYFILGFLVIGLSFVFAESNPQPSPGPMMPTNFVSVPVDMQRVDQCVMSKLGLTSDEYYRGPVAPERLDPAKSSCLQELNMSMTPSTQYQQQPYNQNNQIQPQNQMMGPDYGSQNMMQGQNMGPQMGGNMQGGPNLGGNDQMRRGPPMPPINEIKRGINMLEKTLLTMFNKAKKQVEIKYKTQLPVECTEAYTQVKSIIDVVKPALQSYKPVTNSTNVNTSEGNVEDDAMIEALSQMSDLDEYIPTIENCIQTAQFIKQAPRIFKKADAEIKRLRKEVERLKKAEQKANMFLPQISEVDQSVSDIETLLNTIKEEFKTNPEAMERLNEEIFPVFGENWENLDMAKRVMDGVKKIKPFIKSSDKEIKNISKQITKLQKNADVSGAQNLYNQLQAQLTAIKEMVNNKDYEVIDEEMMTYFEIQDELQNALRELRGEEEQKFVPQGFENFYSKPVEMPDAFQSFMKSNSSGNVNPVGESNPQPSPGPQMNDKNFMENFLEKLTPNQKDSLFGNILKLFGR